MPSYAARLLVALFLLGTAPVAAQTVPVSGTVTDAEDGSPLPGATVLLTALAADSTQAGTATGSDGAFRLDVPPGDYRLRVSFVGYIAVEQTVSADGEPLAPIALLSDAEVLGEIGVEATRQRVEVRGDTTAFNADAFPVTPDASVQDLVARMPGIVIQDGEVQAQGERVRRVLVDGEEFLGDDATAALRNLPAEIVQEIQVFDRQSEQARFTGFDDGDEERTINVVTRPGMRAGQFGRVQAGGGPDGRYLGTGNLSYFNGARRISVVGLTNNVGQQNFATEDLLGVAGAAGGRGGRGGGGRGGRGGPGGGGPGGGGPGGGGVNPGDYLIGERSGINTISSIGVNYSDRFGERLRLTSSLFLNRTENDTDAALERTYLLDEATSRYAETARAQSTDDNARLNARIEFAASERTQLVVSPRLSLQDHGSGGLLSGFTSSLTGSPLSQSTTDYRADRLGYDASTNVLLRHRFATPGRTVSVGLTLGIADRSGTSEQRVLLASFDSGEPDDESDQRITTTAEDRRLGGSLSFTERLGERGQFQLSYRPSLSWSTSDQRGFLFDDNTGGYTSALPALTSAFTQRTMLQRGGVSARFSGEGWNGQLGLDLQHEQLEGDPTGGVGAGEPVAQTFLGVLPSARLRVDLGETTRLSLNAQSRTRTPSVGQLQGVVDNSNPLFLSVGSPDLRPSTTHGVRAQLRRTDAEGGGVLVGVLSLDRTSNFIGSSTLVALDGPLVVDGLTLPAGAQLTRPANLDGAWNARAFLTLGRPIPALRSNTNLTAGVTYARTPSLVNNEAAGSQTVGLDGRVFLGSAASERFDASLELGARYTMARPLGNETLGRNDDFVRYRAVGRATWLAGSGFVLSTDLRALHDTGLDTANPTRLLWNAGLGYRFLPDESMELRLSVADLLDQNRDLDRVVTDFYVEDRQFETLGRHVMLTLSYRLRHFGGR